MNFASVACALWHFPQSSSTGLCTYFLVNSSLRSTWHSRHRSVAFSSVRFGYGEECGLWQMLQSPAATGPCTNCLLVLLFSWHEKHSSLVVAFFRIISALDWCGSWQAMQSPVATGLCTVRLASLRSWQA